MSFDPAEIVHVAASETILRAWFEKKLTAILALIDEKDAAVPISNPAVPSPTTQTQLGEIMATVTDIQTQLSANEATQTAFVAAVGTLITDFGILVASNASLTAQLTAATAAGDSAATATIIAQMQADQVKMQAALAAATAAIGTMPAGTPTPPGQPTIG